MDEYIAWRMECDQTYKQGPMQTVSINIDGEEYVKTFHGDKVKDALYLFGIDVEDCDDINLDPNSPLKDGDQIVIKAGGVPLEKERPFVHFTPLLPEGKTRIIFTNGRPNPERKVFDFEIETFVDATFLRDFALREGLESYKRIWVYVGNPSAHVSALTAAFEDVTLDKNNHPVTYLEKFENQVAVAYSSNNRRTKTNSGRTTIPGHVAIRTDRFPYGTRMFIVSKDGSFVYGNAIAADTGTALKEGTCDLDLIFDSYEESCWFGKKFLDVYVLEYGNEQPE